MWMWWKRWASCGIPASIQVANIFIFHFYLFLLNRQKTEKFSLPFVSQWLSATRQGSEGAWNNRTCFSRHVAILVENWVFAANFHWNVIDELQKSALCVASAERPKGRRNPPKWTYSTKSVLKLALLKPRSHKIRSQFSFWSQCTFFLSQVAGTQELQPISEALHMPLISLERYMATRRAQTYERDRHVYHVAFSILVVVMAEFPD